MAGSVILAGARTPIGKLSGSLAGFEATDLGALAIRAALHLMKNPYRLLLKIKQIRFLLVARCHPTYRHAFFLFQT